ncbi:RING-5 domain-containing protein [Coniophora puteana RWD-64-598 SS2]|uniref:RBR-type E3 ubiquitin transferase n=1 Tax=Coniophora puteana (strain RWD-64-598) TaxID=741705 RepID=A0A5M3MW30_CONPW|nr:RING-5 domain-containing protein [Coniophora puteana RWD-64-598 SS2]EIW83372.1 RING-5 domain-containing protein [Coniophora puteana RWD-64-598 SS2]
MSSDYEYSDDEYLYDDDDEDMLSPQDGSAASSDDDMAMDTFGDDFKVPPREKRKSYEVDHDSLSHDAVKKLMAADVDHIAGIFGVDANTAELLLHHLAWNKERLIEKYMDNASAVSVAAGISLPSRASPSSSAAPIRYQGSSTRSSAATRRPARQQTPGARSLPPSSPSSNDAVLTPALAKQERFVCPICFDDSQTRFLSLSCEHQFCAECWNAYVTGKIREEGEHAIRCMAEGCALVAPRTFVLRDALPAPSEDKGTRERYEELQLRHFVASTASLKYCPYPSCTYTVSCPAASTKSSLISMVPTVTCGANATPAHKFCFGCAIESDHRPVICPVARMWLQKCEDDSETANWIKSNTKECSKCQSTIEKNGGCNHMTCKKCKHEFCWVCMGPWSEHGSAWYSCNRYDEKAGVDARDAQSKSRASLERYLHYYNRWANHEQSAKLSVELYSKTEKKMEEMQLTSELTWIEVQFMRKAVDEVEKCRMTLKWTYAMAYYLDKGNEKELFEDNQRDLERAVEDLSELLESPIDPEAISMLRQKVTDRTVYVSKRNEIMLEDTATGFQEGRWKWNVPVEGFD